MAVLSPTEYLVLLRQDIQGMCDDCKMLYEPSIVGAQAKKLANLLDTLRSRELSYCLYQSGIGLQSIGGKYVTQVLHFLVNKHALGQFQLEVCIHNLLQHCSQVVKVFLQCSGEG